MSDIETRRASVCILLATYNGAAFLREQLDSLAAQTFRDWVLVVRDDGSTDETVSIVREYASRDARVKPVTDGLGNVGAARNFGLLLEHPLAAAYDYLMCCDQDDVWDADKIERTLAAAKRAEAEEGHEVPLLVHTDLAVVDRELRPVHTSFLRFQGIRHEARSPLRTLLVQNFVTGCTMLFNQPLRRLAAPLPAEMVMHDWWLAACAAAGGRIEFVPGATIRYRQHGRNQVGARGFWRTLNPLRRDWDCFSPAAERRFLQAVRQGLVLDRHLEARLGPGRDESRQVLGEFARLFAPNLSRAARLWGLWRAGFRRQDPLRNLLLRLRVLTTPGSRFGDATPGTPLSPASKAAA